MKSVLIISEVFWPENFLINDLATQLKEQGYIVDILTQYPSYPYGKIYKGYNNCNHIIEEWEGSKIYRFKVIEGYKESTIKKLLNYIYFVYKGKHIARSIKAKYDFVMVSQTGPLTVALPGIAYAKKNKSKLLIWTQDIWPDAVYAYGFKRNCILDFFLNKFIRKIYCSCDKIFVSSRQFKASLRSYVPNKDIYYMPNWLLPSEEKDSTITLDSSKFNITFTGNISLYQNLTNVLRGFKLANLDHIVLNIIGDGSELNELKALVQQEDIEHVVFHGQHPANEMHDILMQSDALILSLISDEGIQKTEPFKLQTYLKSGKPILGVIGGSGREIIEKYDLGICAHPDNIEEIASKFKEIANFTEEQQERVISNAQTLMNTRFNRDIIFKQFLEHLK